MAYNTNVPNGGQSPGLFPSQNNENFNVLQNLINREHIFNSSPSPGDNSATHRQVTMTNRDDPSSLPTGTNGMLFLNNSGQLTFYNGSSNTQLSNPIRASLVCSNTGATLGSAFNATCTTATVGGERLYTIAFSTALPSNNYLWSVAAYENGVNVNANPLIVKVQTVNVNMFKFYVVNQNNSDASGVVTSITFMAFGG